MKDKTEPSPASALTVEALVEVMKQLQPEQLNELLKRAEVVPTTTGMTPEQIQTVVMTAGAANARAMQLALRRENPNYPERSVFNPKGVFTDDGVQLPPKVKLSRETYYVGVRLGGELETPEEIELFNRFTGDRDARGGKWTARLTNVAGKERLVVDFPHRNTDERMELPSDMKLILRELLLGEAAVNPATMSARIATQDTQIKEMQEKIEALMSAKAAA